MILPRLWINYRPFECYDLSPTELLDLEPYAIRGKRGAKFMSRISSVTTRYRPLRSLSTNAQEAEITAVSGTIIFFLSLSAGPRSSLIL